MLMSGRDYRESLRRYRPSVYVNGHAVASVADEPLLAPGVNAIALTYDYALRDDWSPLMQRQGVNRLLAIPQSAQDLIDKLEAVRLVCQETGCAQRYLAGDGFAAIRATTTRMDAEIGSEYGARFEAYAERAWAEDLAIGIAMTDAKGDRTLRPHRQPNRDAYLRIAGRDEKGIRLSGTKAIITGAPYMHELLVMPCRKMNEADRDYAVCCAVPVDAPGLTLVARPAGRPGDEAATFSSRYGQSTAVGIFEDVFIPWERVFLAGETDYSGSLTYAYATHHRHTCIGARAGFGDLLIGAGVLMTEANGIDLDLAPNLRESLVELIKIVEGFYACGIAASTYATMDTAGVAVPDAIFANVGKLLLATQIYDMYRLAHHVSGGLVVALPGPDDDHNPATGGRLAELLEARPGIPYQRRIDVARLIEDLTASSQGGWYSVISLHGGGSPEAMKMEIWRQYPVRNRVELVERLLERGAGTAPAAVPPEGREPARCCTEGCGVVSRSPRPAVRSVQRDVPQLATPGEAARPATLVEP